MKENLEFYATVTRTNFTYRLTVPKAIAKNFLKLESGQTVKVKYLGVVN